MFAPPCLYSRGQEDYLTTLAAMRAHVEQYHASDLPDQIWLVEHAPVFTLGQAGKPEHVLKPGDIPVLRVERGGQVTYHGPGQVVIYPLLQLKRYQLKVRDYVFLLEQAVIDLLAGYSIVAQREAGAPGVYLAQSHGILAGAKIAALGIKVSRGMSFHGVSLNVTMDLTPFQAINPCGYPGMVVTDMQRVVAQMPCARSNPPPLLFSTIQAELGHTLVSALTQRLT